MKMQSLRDSLDRSSSQNVPGSTDVSDVAKSLLESAPWQTALQSSWDSSDYLYGSSKTTSLRSLIAVRNDRIFYWNNKDSCLVSANFRDPEMQNFIKIECDIAPLFEAREIVCSPYGSCVAVVGARGLSVINTATDDIPEHGRKVSHCIAIAERFFLNNPKIHILQFEWFSMRETHFLVLTSDNNLRLFRLASPSQPDLVVSLHGSSNKLSLHNFTAFCTAHNGDVSAASAYYRSPENESATVTIFALRSDGLVYTFDMTAGYDRCVASSVRGPVNNIVPFGGDVSHFASSIAYISASVPVLIIASNGDKLVHGLLLEKDDIEADNTSSGAILSSSWEFITLEKLELVTSAENIRNLPKSHHARLLSRRDIPGCYAYITEHRIFGIAVPWLDDLSMLENMDLESLRSSDVRTILSSDPFETSNDLFFLGAQLITSDTNECSLLSVASNGQVSIQPICVNASSGKSGLKIPDFKSKTQNKSNSEVPFSELIQNLLRRERNLPVFNMKNTDQLSAEDLQQVLDHGVSIYTEEYMNRQAKAAQAIRNRQERLKARRRDLANLISAMDQKAAELTEKLHEFSNQCDYVRIEMEDTDSRLSTLQSNLSDWNPALTTAEMELQNNLDELHFKIGDIEELLKTVEEKLVYRQRQKELHNAVTSAAGISGNSYEQMHKQATDQLIRMETIKRRIADLKEKVKESNGASA
ncbi:nuclear pore complex protein Nup88-like [Paramacrobiotus metropolitanus]|uniref:nuclear pore complex protein Nup88-like n=1 Tax=Paramacrobiotus metropolitanus TaxID=2943436 RepID=UPI0024458B68|nr:nuclear pore complex protein Nup88-like [Paramacrobiotus metropolitanus]